MRFARRWFVFLLGALSCVTAAEEVLAGGAREPALSAAASDPRTLGWMRGAPPPPDKVIGQPDSDYFSFPKMRWTVCHFRELLPTKAVSRGLGAPVPLDRALDDGIDAITFKPLGSDAPMTFRESLDANYTDGLLILHDGRIVYEHYSGCLDAAGKHGAMSMTKSLTGLLAEILVAEGKLDDTAPVKSIIPELAESAFGSATVREVMDMTTALDFSENYADPNADIWVYGAAGNPLPKPAGYTGPIGYYAFLETVRQKGAHGEAFGYKTVNTDVLGWIVSRVADTSLTGLLSERIWSRMGAEQDAYFTIDALGTPFAGGGLSAGLRDLARIGQLMLDEGVINGERLFPAAVVRNIRAGGDKAAFEKAGFETLPGGSYRSMWWVFHNAHGAYAARGVHGQTIYVDPTARMVLVRFASHPKAKNAAIDPTSLPAYQAVAEYLVNKQAGVSLPGGEWRIAEIRGVDDVGDAKTAFSFRDDGRIAMTVGCNRLMATPEIKGSNIRIGPVVSTRMACPPNLDDMERKLLSALEATRSFKMSSSQSVITFKDADGVPQVALSKAE